MDSALIAVACYKLNLKPTIFCHVKGPFESEFDDSDKAKIIAEKFGFDNTFYIDHQGFDPIDVFQERAIWFGGAAPYLFSVLAANVHQKVVEKNCDVLLSGFGGDECVTGHGKNYITSYMQQHGFKRCWQEIKAHYTNKKLKFRSLRILKQLIKAQHPFKNISTVHEHEASLLQGKLSEHLRLRIKYSDIVASHLGFNYQYPLLFSPLVEFCHRLPIEYKRRGAVSRWIARRYLADNGFGNLYQDHNKNGSIAPATKAYCLEQFKQGAWDNFMRDLPLKYSYKNEKNDTLRMAHYIHAYMDKFAKTYYNTY